MGAHTPDYWLLTYDLWDRSETAASSILSIRAQIEVASIGSSIIEADRFAQQHFHARLEKTRLVKAEFVGSEQPHMRNR